MHERFESARRIEQAVVHSDLARVQLEARAISASDEPDALPQWRPYLDRIATSSHNIERAADVVAAAKATAALGRECARCHEATAAKIVFSADPRPTADTTLLPQMLGHQWAAARMWDGLIGPSNDRWLEGAQALTQVPLTIVAEEPMTVKLKDMGLADGEKIGDDVARVRLYANRALAMRDQDGRAAIFGELLATCAHCHAAIRDR